MAAMLLKVRFMCWDWRVVWLVRLSIGNIDFFVLLIFRKTSYINGKLFPPWLDIDLKERFAYPDYFRYEFC